MNLVEHERELYTEMWGIESYAAHSPGEQMVPLFLDMAGRRPQMPTVLDAGCGSGKGAIALSAAGFQVTTCDLVDARLPEAARFPFREVCLWHDLTNATGYQLGGKFDYVFCTDVLEHIPPQFTMLVIARLLAVTRIGLFLNIALVPGGSFEAYVGESLHKSVFSFVWWRDALASIATVEECRDLAISGVYYVRPR